MPEPIAVTDATFQDEVLESQLPALVDFWATWCGPCKMIAPTVEQVARDLDGHLKVVRLNADENVQTTMRYGVMGLPTLLLFVGGVPAEDRLVGFVTKDQVLSYLEEARGNRSGEDS